ncbi:MAG: FAD-dependent oxidoreductase [Proteobacteria bacterium]|nr:FAD-dependent oxidoreductase [Pseudomonadota bacterium]
MNHQLTRRQLIARFGAAAFASTGLFGATNTAFASNAAHVVIVGGGVGGAAAAKYLRLLDGNIRITLIEPNPVHVFCPGSNEVLVGHETLENLTFDYSTMRTHYAVNVIQALALEINYAARQLKLSNGDNISYDKLIVSPGPDDRYDLIDGYTRELAETDFPHAWKAGAQTLKLKQQIESMPQGGKLVISSPQAPYRCPPAPYERASFIANHLKQTNPSAKIIILDSKDNFVFDKQYIDYWTKHHGFGTENARIEWVPANKGGRVTAFDAKTKTLTTTSGSVTADVVNIIPAEKAGRFAVDTGLTQGKQWVPVQAKTFASVVDPNVFVIGDTVDMPMPKTGYIASNQAKVVVQAIVDMLAGREPATPFITNNCVAMAGEDYGMTITATFRFAGDHYAVQERRSVVDGNEYIGHLRASIAKNWQRTFRKDIAG